MVKTCTANQGEPRVGAIGAATLSLCYANGPGPNTKELQSEGHGRGDQNAAGTDRYTMPSEFVLVRSDPGPAA